jgi:Xaa-Pro aminopeptidase
MTDVPERDELIAARLAERECDALLVTGLVNVRWLTGFTGSNAAALVGADAPDGARGARVFATDFRYLTVSAEQVSDRWERLIHLDLLQALVDALPPSPREGEPLRLGFDDVQLSVREHARLRELLPEGVELVAAGGLVEELRAVKDRHELERIRAAALLADAALTEVLNAGIVGHTERAVALELEIRMRRLGAEGVSFPPIVAAGAHGALPHAEPRDVEIPAGTLVVIDWGAQLDGYASDCTRTFATGTLDPRDAEIYELVLAAQEASLAAVRAGRLGREVDAVARDIIDGAGHAEHFGHGLGHGVGMEVHEGPRLSKQGETALVPGMVVTVEPGVYVPGAVGVRIEDLVVVTDDEPDVLSTLPKALRVVE